MNEFIFKHIDEMSGREFFCVERLRTDAFVTEQKITLPELDDIDLKAIQVYLLNSEQTNALATCRIFKDEKLGWMFGRVAVNQKKRGQHLGSKMMLAVHKYLQAQGVTSVCCHAQIHAKAFYDSLGYIAVGTPFDEGGVAHVMMKKELA